MNELIIEEQNTITVDEQFSLRLLEPDRSSLVRALGFDDGDGILLVQLKNAAGEPTDIYRYLTVPEFHFVGMQEAESVGGYLNMQIIPVYHCERLEEETGRWYAAERRQRARPTKQVGEVFSEDIETQRELES